MRIRHLPAAISVLALAVAGPFSASPANAQTSAPALHVEPDSGLVDGQSVRYEGSGFSAGSSIAILQCIPGATSMTEVLARCEIRQSPTVDATGSFSGFVTVERMLQPMTGTGTVDCAAAPGACAISAFDLSSTVVDALVTFADPSARPPAVSVSPAADLADGDVVSVTGTDFPAGASVTVAQCVSSRPATTEWCDGRPPVTVAADAAGAFAVELTVHRGITLPAGSVVDCAGDATTPCAITAFTSDGSSWATMPVGFTFRRVLATASSPLAVSPQGTVEVTGMLYCSVPSSDAVEISGTITQTLEDRVVSADFTATSSCPAVFGSWSAHVGGSQTQRFKPGTASVTSWGVEATDPVPGDAERLGTEVQLVRTLG
jgi:hypothetical protein